MQLETSEELNRYMAERAGGAAVLSFSTGKDSLAAWLVMREYFTEIYPVYLYLIPGLSFVEESLAYYESFFQTKIFKLPHPSIYRMIRNMVFCEPQRCRLIEESPLPKYGYDEVFGAVRQVYHLKPDTPAAVGVRARDSLNRWTSIKRFGAYNEKRAVFYPIFDFTKKRVLETLKASGVSLPVDYRLFGRTFDGIDYRFLAPLKEHYPEDYQKILDFFPLAELEIRRMDYRRAYWQERQAEREYPNDQAGKQ